MFRNALTIAAVASLLATLPSAGRFGAGQADKWASKAGAAGHHRHTTRRPPPTSKGLPGIGAKTAAHSRIRQKNGPFKRSRSDERPRHRGERTS